MSKSTPPEYNRLKVVLAEKKKTNKELADYLKVRPGTVSRWCTNDSQPNIATLFAIAKFLGVKVCSLLVET
jgi:transcriptional regulator with XRE-family HTH domain